jgi:hypothetical protein
MEINVLSNVPSANKSVHCMQAGEEKNTRMTEYLAFKKVATIIILPYIRDK